MTVSEQVNVVLPQPGLTVTPGVPLPAAEDEADVTVVGTNVALVLVTTK